jgi:hypothetical protein
MSLALRSATCLRRRQGQAPSSSTPCQPDDDQTAEIGAKALSRARRGGVPHRVQDEPRGLPPVAQHRVGMPSATPLAHERVPVKMV